MKVSLITACSLNRRKLEENSPQKSYAFSRNSAVTDVFVKNQSVKQPQFGSLISETPSLNELSRFFGIIDPYTGKPMLPLIVTEQLSKMASTNQPKGFSQQAIRFIDKVISRPDSEGCLSEVNQTVFDRIKTYNAAHPGLDLHETMKGLRKESLPRVLKIEDAIFNDLNKLADYLPEQIRYNMHSLIAETKKNANTQDKFRRKIFLAKLDQIISDGFSNKILKGSNHVVSKIRQKANSIPTSLTSADGFIVKYSRAITPEKNVLSQKEVLEKIAAFENTARGLFSKKKYQKTISEYVERLKSSIKNNPSYYKEAKKNLIKRLNSLNPDILSTSNDYTLLTKGISEFPNKFSTPEQDLMARTQAIAKRIVEDTTVSAEHLVPQEDFKQIPNLQKELGIERDSVGNLLLVGKVSNNLRGSKAFSQYIQENPEIIYNYMPAHFDSIFKLISTGKVGKEYLPELKTQIQTVEKLSKGLIKIDTSKLKQNA